MSADATKAEREARLAAALRQNLQRRKAARARPAEGGGEGDPPPRGGSGGS